MASGKGGKPGQWSARKAQLVAQKYEAAGGGYSGSKSGAQKSLSKWTTKSGKPSTQGPKATGERYLPKKAIQSMPSGVYASSTAAKRKASAEGKQFSSQPESAKKIARRFR